MIVAGGKQYKLKVKAPCRLCYTKLNRPGFDSNFAGKFVDTQQLAQSVCYLSYLFDIAWAGTMWYPSNYDVL